MEDEVKVSVANSFFIRLYQLRLMPSLEPKTIKNSHYHIFNIGDKLASPLTNFGLISRQAVVTN